MLAELVQGLRALGASVPGALRGDKTSALCVTDVHARFQEAVLQGNVYSLATLVAGVTVGAANVFSAAAAQPLVGIYNPPTSGRNAVIWYGSALWNSGTPGTGGLVWGTSPVPPLASLASANAPINSLTLSAGSAMRGFVNSALTGITGNQLHRYAGGPAAFALAAGAPAYYVDMVDGAIIVPPGAACGLYAGAVGTSPIINASMFWEEIVI
jgi:hypothetical protein